MAANKTLYTVWLLVLTIGIAFGLFSALRVVVTGLGVFNTNDVVFWGLPMAGYLFFGLTAAGLTLISSLPTVFGLKSLYPVAKRASLLAGAMLVMGLACKFFDLGPIGTLTNLVWVVFSPNLASPIWWMAILYGVYLLFVVLKFWKINKGHWHSHGGMETAVAALLLAFISYSALSVVFGTVEARPVWFGALTGIYFLTTAITSGLAAVLLASVLHFRLGGREAVEAHETAHSQLGVFLAFVLAGSLVIMLSRLLTTAFTHTQGLAGLRHMALGFSFNVELWIGLVLPLIIFSIAGLRRSDGWRIFGSLLVLLGMFAGRLEMLLAGNVAPMGVQIEGRAAFVSYVPSMYEWGIIVLALSVVLMIYSIGERAMNLSSMPEQA